MKLKLQINKDCFFMRCGLNQSYLSCVSIISDGRYSVFGKLLEDLIDYKNGGNVRSIRRLLKLCSDVI